MFDISSVPINRRSVEWIPTWRNPLGVACLFGIPPESGWWNPLRRWKPLRRVPANSREFDFLLGGGWTNLIQAFVSSKCVRTARVLRIGSSTYGSGSESLDYRTMVAALGSVTFPCLETLGVGVCELFCNAHYAYGTVGNLDHVSVCAPNLRSLSIGGRFDLTVPLELSSLESLSVTLDDPTTLINGGPITQETLECLLKSELPSLREILVDLDVWESNKVYSLPESVLNAESWPALEVLEICGTFRADQKAMLSSSWERRGGNLRILLDEFRAPDGDTNTEEIN